MEYMIYKDASRPVDERVEDLIARMTPLEKACQLSCAYAYGGQIDLEGELSNGIGQVGMSCGAMTPQLNAELVNGVQKYLIENTRLGIPALFHVETLNGGSVTGATTYPIPLGLAASWNPKAVEQMGDQIRQEMTACGQKIALAPVLDVSRDPRWGRMGETYGECPELVSRMGSAYIRGVQGEGTGNEMAACAKHFLGYATSEGGMNMSGSHMGPRELREVYAKPFRDAFERANLKGVMNCYLAVDGEPLTGSKRYLTDLLRGEMGFQGVTIADYGSMDKLCDVFHLAADKADAGRMALEAGLDTEAPRRVCLGDEFAARLERGEIPTETVDAPLRRFLKLKFELGVFEAPYMDTESMARSLQAEGHRATSYKLACESMTLLKNEQGVLPLREKKKIAVIGPNADNCRSLFGGYTYPAFYESMRDMLLGLSKSMGLEGVEAGEEQMAFLQQIVSMLPETEVLLPAIYPGLMTVLDAVREASGEAGTVSFARGCGLMDGDTKGFAEAVALAENSDVVLFVCGGRNGSGDGCTMGENVDSSKVGLPGVQEKLAKALATTGKPLVIVHMDGKPLSSVWAKEKAAAILEAWHPGQLGAQAIADTLFGRNNPCGKLPVTAVRHSGQIPLYAEQPNGSGVSNRGQGNNNITQGYVDEPGFPLWPFGYGISYTSFAISDIALSGKDLPLDGEIKVSCTVANTGSMAGSETVQLYFRDLMASAVRPNKELCDFARVTLQPGEVKRVELSFHAKQSAFVGYDLKWHTEPGEIELLIGNSSDALTSAGLVTINK